MEHDDDALTWQDAGKVDEYVERVGRLAARAAGDAELVESLPDEVDRVLDLGCGDGRLLEVVCGHDLSSPWRSASTTRHP